LLDCDVDGLSVLQHLGQVFEGGADLDEISLELVDVFDREKSEHEAFRNLDSVLRNKRLGESQKSLTWDTENLRDGDGSKASHVDGFGLLESLEHPRIQIEHGAAFSPRGVVRDWLGPVFPVGVIIRISEGSSQSLRSLGLR
jgi:hypothetical protein